MNHIDRKYIRQMGTSLQRFTELRNGELYNFRCPYCGDSEKDDKKTRGYFYSKKGEYKYKCHNCGTTANLPMFMEDHFPHLRSQWNLEKFQRPLRRAAIQDTIKEEPKFEHQLNYEQFISHTNSISDANDEVLNYIKDRNIPEDQWKNFYWTDSYWALVRLFDEKKAGDPKKPDEPRIVFPFFNKYKRFVGFAGRAIRESKLRYSTIRLYKSEDTLVYGYDRYNKSKVGYILEGQIDSLFLPNAIAIVGLQRDMSNVDVDKNKTYVLLDNQRRHKDVVKQMPKLVKQGFKVCLWPEYLNGKDVNDFIQNGHTSDELIRVIEKNSYSGLEFNLHFAKWKKV